MNNNTSSEQPNPETETEAEPAKMAVHEKVIAACLGLAVITFLVVVPGKALYDKYTKDLATVSCHKCDHMVKKSTATSKKQFKHLVGKDGDFNRWWFCSEHAPAWDYAIHDRFFKNQMDLECLESGQVLTNKEVYGTLHFGGTNESWATAFYTNVVIGGSLNTKHINY